MAITVYSESWCTNFKNEGKDLSQRINKKCELNNRPPPKKKNPLDVFLCFRKQENGMIIRLLK